MRASRPPSGLPAKISDFSNEKLDADRLMDLIAQDKKVKRGTLTFILVRGIGKSFIARECRSRRHPRIPVR